MGIFDRFRPTAKDEGNRSDGGTVDRSPSIDRPTHIVRYTDADGRSVELQTYSAVSAEMIKEQHPDAVIMPTKHQ